MRRIISEEEMRKKKKRNNSILGAIMLIILVSGTAGYAFIVSPYDTSSNNNQNDPADGRWVLNYQGRQHYFINSPDSVSDIPLDTSKNINSYAGSITYLVSDNDAVSVEIASILGSYSARVQKACLGSCEEDLPEKDCSENLIVFRESLENKVYEEENCVFIEGDLRAADAFLYNLFRV